MVVGERVGVSTKFDFVEEDVVVTSLNNVEQKLLARRINVDLNTEAELG
jgi:hypothetical protein